MNLKSLTTLDCRGALDVSRLKQPWDDTPDLKADPTCDPARKLDADKAHWRTATARSFADLRTRPEAIRHLERLPEAGESLHAIISGTYALWDLVPAIIERSGQRIDALHIATLSFSTANAKDLLDLLDAGQIGTAALLVSHYFKATNQSIYDYLIPQLVRRGQKVLAMRTHCKLLLVALADGRRFTVESSANLRSCKNIEQFVMTQDQGLYQFHRDWMEKLLCPDPEPQPRS